VPRPSPVRDRVRDLLLEGSRHAWSLDELLEQVRRDIGSADYSSVFRAVAFLEQQGQVQKVELGDGRSRWEQAEPHHDHVLCTDCGRVAELRRACRLVDSDEELGEATGFQISGHYLVFTGLCPDCQSR
jgi:Fur family transcriptional regulator, peroxide stress response regulator